MVLTSELEVQLHEKLIKLAEELFKGPEEGAAIAREDIAGLLLQRQRAQQLATAVAGKCAAQGGCLGKGEQARLQSGR